MTTITALDNARTIDIKSLQPSKHNPRRSLDQTSLAELVTSIKDKGILEPLLVRSQVKPGTFEIVAGERRYRAAIKAGLGTVPVIVRDDFTDADVAEVRLIENLQREALAPVDEADAFAKLQGEQKYTVPEISAKIGKSVSYVYQRLALLNLPENARTALQERRITEAVALVIARIPHEKQRSEAAEAILAGPEPMTLLEAREHVRYKYMLALKTAPFDQADAGLVAGVGACAACPKRTGGSPGLFEDFKAGESLCLDADCFASKRDATWQRKAQKASERGLTVIEDKVARKVLAHGQVMHGTPFVNLDAACDQDPKRRTWRKLLGKHAKGAAIARDPETQDVVTLLDKGTAHKLLTVAAPEIGKAVQRLSDSRKREIAAQERRDAQDAIACNAVIDALVDRIQKQPFAVKHLRLIAHAALDNMYSDMKLETLARAWGVQGTQNSEELDDAVKKTVDTLDEPALRVGIVVSLLFERFSPRHITPQLKATAMAWGVDIARVAADAAKAARGAGRDKKPTKAARRKKGGK